MRIPIGQIIPDPNQPRKTFDDDAIKKLASSFESYGVISPLKVRPCGDNQYMIIVGEMRYRAAKEKGDGEIECIVQEATDQQTWEMQFIENLQRNDIDDGELGQSFVEYCKCYKCTMGELARRIAKPRFFVEERVAVATKLHPHLHKEEAKPLTFTEKRELTKIEDKERQLEVAEVFITGEVSSTHIAKICEIAQKEPTRPIADIVGEITKGKVAEKEAARVEAAKRALEMPLETPEDLERAAEALKKEAKRKAKEAMSPEKKAALEAEKRAKEQAKAEAKRLEYKERKRKKAEENQKREERAEKKARKQLLENHSFLGEVLAKAPTELIEERIYTPEQREILKKPTRPTTQWDRFNELAKLADKLSNGLAELPQIPAFAKMTLGVTLQSLRARIDETLERMGMQIVEVEVKRIKGGGK